MSNYRYYVPEFNPVVTFNEDQILEGISDDDEMLEVTKTMIWNVCKLATEAAYNMVREHITKLTEHFNEAMDARTTELDHMQWTLETLDEAFNATQESLKVHKELVKHYNESYDLLKRQLDQLPADAGNGGSGRQPKMPDPPTFSGSGESKSTLEDWLNHVTLYCSSVGIVTDKQKIIYALGRLRSPATTYMRSYFDKNRENKDLGSWDDFIKELWGIYGQLDESSGAKDEIAKLWENKHLAKEDFLKYAEQYKTLARLVDYEDKLHIDKLFDVIPQDLRQTLVYMKVSNTVPKKWTEFMDILILMYKELHPKKVQSHIFQNGKKDKDNGNSTSNDKGKGKQEANSSNTQKAKKFCKICDAMGKKSKAKSHNTDDCYDKPGNESKRPAASSSLSSGTSSSAQGQQRSGSASGTSQGSRGPGVNKPRNFSAMKARAMELLATLKELDSDEAGTSPAGTANISTASIQEVVDDPAPAVMAVTQESNEPVKGPGRNLPRFVRRTQVDFPKGL